MCELPAEILVKIISYLPLSDVLRSASTSRRFQHASNIMYQQRRNETREEYGPHYFFSNLDYSEVQTILLSNSGVAVGLHKVTSTEYGGLIEVKFDGYRLVGTRYFPPTGQHLDRPLRFKKIFAIDIDSEGECECICFQGCKGPHKADISKFEADGFQVNCKDAGQHRDPDSQLADFKLWLCEELDKQKVDELDDFELEDDLLKPKYETLSQELLLKCLPLHLAPHQESAVIQPGLFIGSYSAHGLELIQLTYDNDENVAVLTKITGDPNIPAGQITIMAELNERILDDNHSKDEGVQTEVSPSGLPLQRFRLPNSIYNTEHEVPEFFLHRFKSNGQIASNGYVDATFIRGQWVVFDEDTFGHAWLDLSTFAMFKRVTQTF